MSLHFLLGLSYDCTDDLLEKSYKKKLVEYHPDRSKKNTKDVYYALKDAYDRYKRNITNENFYLQCPIEEVNFIFCRCGTPFDKSNLVLDRIECESCSCFVLVCKKSVSICGDTKFCNESKY